MIKVIYTNGTEANFHGKAFTHNAQHKMFFIPTIELPLVQIPDHCVACIGIWDKENEEFMRKENFKPC